MSKTLLVLFSAVFVFDAVASDVSYIGQVSVIDGDTIEIRGQRIRFHGIDAPESGQQCIDGAGRLYRCGTAAAFALDQRIGDQNVECLSSRFDQYDRAIAVCFVDGRDLGAWLVEEGYAVAYRKYATDYIDTERLAKEEGPECGKGLPRCPGTGESGTTQLSPLIERCSDVFTGGTEQRIHDDSRKLDQVFCVSGIVQKASVKQIDGPG